MLGISVWHQRCPLVVGRTVFARYLASATSPSDCSGLHARDVFCRARCYDEGLVVVPPGDRIEVRSDNHCGVREFHAKSASFGRHVHFHEVIFRLPTDNARQPSPDLSMMVRIHLKRRAISLQPPRNPRLGTRQVHNVSATDRLSRVQGQPYHTQDDSPLRCRHFQGTRQASSTATVRRAAPLGENWSQGPPRSSHQRASRSAKLAALHARLSLTPTLPVQTLARCLVDPTADSRATHNNSSLATLGQDLLGYYTAEHLITHYPRLPMAILFAAQYAYVGVETLASLRKEWGVEVAAAPGSEVDPGLLQLDQVDPSDAGSPTRWKGIPDAGRIGTGRQNEHRNFRRGWSSRVIFDDEFGDLQSGLPSHDTPPFAGAPISEQSDTSTAETSSPSLEALSQSVPAQDSTALDSPHRTTVTSASAAFVRALTASLYLHAGASASKAFHRNHILSRHLELEKIFHFPNATLDLSRLCKREGYERPVARLLSETGRLSRSPVFVVGVYSGDDKIGEGVGSSLEEGKVRAAAAALRSWYLYSPLEQQIMRPSDVLDETGKNRRWKPQHVDIGEIVA